MSAAKDGNRTGTLRGLLLCPLVAVLACSGGDGSAPGTALIARERRDVVLITVDTLRHDATGFSGAGRVATPAIDGLAETGRVWPFAHAHSVVTLPSHATILTGLLPFEHGIRDNAGFVLPTDLPTLATVLSAEGYATAAFVSAFPLDRRFGLARGFDVYDDAYEGHGASEFTFAERPGDATVALALAWWRAAAGRPRLCWVHVFTPHFPYEPREPWASRYADEPYLGDVAMTDAQLEPLLRELLGDPARPIVLLAADHGESLGEHGEATHGVFAYEATLRVPFVLSAPGLVAPGVDPGDARLVDATPTILDLLGFAPLPGASGRSLFATRDGGSYFESLSANLNRGWAPLFGRIEGRQKAIDLPIRELYDLDRDPAELDNRADRAAAEWEAIVGAIPAEALGPVDRDEVDPDVAEKLEGLGYVARSAALREQGAYGPDDDPKARIGDQERMFEALTWYSEGRVDDAIGALTALVADQPRMATAYGHLGFMLADQGRVAEAVRVLERGLTEGADNESVRRRLALLLMRAGRGADAWAVLARHAESADPETQVALGRIAGTLGRDAEAEARIARALEIDPTYPKALVDRGILYLMQGRFAEAEAELRRGLAGEPAHAEGWNALGVIRSRANDLDGALDAWRRAVAADPRLADALFNLALVLGRVGRADEAAATLERYIPLVEGDDRRRAQEMLRQLRAATG